MEWDREASLSAIDQLIVYTVVLEVNTIMGARRYTETLASRCHLVEAYSADIHKGTGSTLMSRPTTRDPTTTRIKRAIQGPCLQRPPRKPTCQCVLNDSFHEGCSCSPCHLVEVQLSHWQIGEELETKAHEEADDH